LFTGIVQTKLKIGAITPVPVGVRLSIERAGWMPLPKGLVLALGDSVCVSGVCLTLAEISDKTMGFDVIPETLRVTRLGALKPGDSVNIEPAMTPSSQFGGHIVQGHVDGVGRVVSAGQSGQEWRVRVALPAELMDYMVPKGSVTLDGVSLTLAALGPDWAEVALIPTTLEVTTLGNLKSGEVINVEADVFAKTVVHFMRRTGGGTAEM
jgi:riboflavin synthase